MAILGLTNPWIILSYVGCILTVVACCVIGFKAKNLNGDEEVEE